jgi:predicted RNase H-like HicB family nuclease
MPKKCFTIEIKKYYDDGEHFVAFCPELNLSVTCDTENEAIIDMKQVVTETLADMSDESLKIYDMDRVAIFHFTVKKDSSMQIA